MPSIALLGQPNSGKSTLFNVLTGSNQHVGNWPGKTVERCEGSFRAGAQQVSAIDLPGSYSLTASSEEERITRDFIQDEKPDLVLVLADASQLNRSLYMLADFARINSPCMLLLNMMDVAEGEGKHIDAAKLSDRLGIAVVPFVATDMNRYEELRSAIASELAHPRRIACEAPERGKEYDWISKLLEGVVSGGERKAELSRFDRVATGRVSGKLLAVLIVLAAFVVAMIFMVPFALVGSLIGSLSAPLLEAMNAAGVMPFLAQIVAYIIPNTFYFAFSMTGFMFGITTVFSFLEDVGYIARVAYTFDGIMSKLGVSGRSICPMLMGFGCTIGAATGARVIDDYGQRVLTIALCWAVPCGAILSVMPVLSSIFFGWRAIFVMIGIILYMMVMMLIVSKVFGARLSPVGQRNGMLMELPPYHKPHWKTILYVSWNRALALFKRAVRIIFVISIIVFLFAYSPTGVEGSLMYKIGIAIEPVTRFFGLGWQTFMAFIASAFAKEAVIGVLNALFSADGSLVAGTFEAKASGITDVSVIAAAMPAAISQAEALAFIFAVSFSVPCVMALSTTYNETHSAAWTIKLALFYMGAALVLSCIVYHIAVLFM